MLGNLRGVRESDNIFAVPTYFFILSIVVLIAVGLFRPNTIVVSVPYHSAGVSVNSQ